MKATKLIDGYTSRMVKEFTKKRATTGIALFQFYVTKLIQQ